ncbi:hypothetical protein CCUS01_05908 [Colletotrichum cuscutae]|uniref:Uncharacterized protein n=1 Tax=Colletotrichum cuscutae TaxID=1209917 RepID=A0AAI9Y1F7_9PEZI|nr:hypothetical protein CCUS01_05908 [Colletotrichum cuscutae]
MASFLAHQCACGEAFPDEASRFAHLLHYEASQEISFDSRSDLFQHFGQHIECEEVCVFCYSRFHRASEYISHTRLRCSEQSWTNDEVKILYVEASRRKLFAKIERELESAVLQEQQANSGVPALKGAALALPDTTEVDPRRSVPAARGASQSISTEAPRLAPPSSFPPSSGIACPTVYSTTFNVTSPHLSAQALNDKTMPESIGTDALTQSSHGQLAPFVMPSNQQATQPEPDFDFFFTQPHVSASFDAPVSIINTNRSLSQVARRCREVPDPREYSVPICPDPRCATCLSMGEEWQESGCQSCHLSQPLRSLTTPVCFEEKQIFQKWDDEHYKCQIRWPEVQSLSSEGLLHFEVFHFSGTMPLKVPGEKFISTNPEHKRTWEKSKGGWVGRPTDAVRLGDELRAVRQSLHTYISTCREQCVAMSSGDTILQELWQLLRDGSIPTDKKPMLPMAFDLWTANCMLMEGWRTYCSFQHLNGSWLPFQTNSTPRVLQNQLDQMLEGYVVAREKELLNRLQSAVFQRESSSRLDVILTIVLLLKIVEKDMWRLLFWIRHQARVSLPRNAEGTLRTL